MLDLGLFIHKYMKIISYCAGLLRSISLGLILGIYAILFGSYLVLQLINLFRKSADALK